MKNRDASEYERILKIQEDNQRLSIFDCLRILFWVPSGQDSLKQQPRHPTGDVELGTLDQNVRDNRPDCQTTTHVNGFNNDNGLKQRATVQNSSSRSSPPKFKTSKNTRSVKPRR